MRVPRPKPGPAQRRMASDIRLHRTVETLCSRAPQFVGFYIARLIDVLGGDADLLDDLLHDAAALDRETALAFGKFPRPPLDPVPDDDAEDGEASR